jgi:hypothetical protein
MAFCLLQKSFAYVEIIFSSENLQLGRNDNWVRRLLGQQMVDEIAILAPMPYWN